MRSLTLIPLCLSISACATVAGKTEYPVQISSNPSQARFSIYAESGEQVRTGETPATVTLKGSAGYFDGETYQVKYSKEGYNDATSTIDSRLSEYYFGNALLDGLIGLLIVDPASGAMWELPEVSSATLRKFD